MDMSKSKDENYYREYGIKCGLKGQSLENFLAVLGFSCKKKKRSFFWRF